MLDIAFGKATAYNEYAGLLRLVNVILSNWICLFLCNRIHRFKAVALP